MGQREVRACWVCRGVLGTSVLCTKEKKGALSPSPRFSSQELRDSMADSPCGAYPHLCPCQHHRHPLLLDGVLPRHHLQRPLPARLGAQPAGSHIQCHEPSPMQNSQCGPAGHGPGQLREARWAGTARPSLTVPLTNGSSAVGLWEVRGADTQHCPPSKPRLTITGSAHGSFHPWIRTSWLN